MSENERRLKVRILVCDAIAQAAHFESATKARNAELYAICDIPATIPQHANALFSVVQY